MSETTGPGREIFSSLPAAASASCSRSLIAARHPSSVPALHVAPPRPVGERRQALMPFLATQVAANPNVTVLEWLNGKPAFSGKVAGMLKDVMMRWATS